ncbi:MAG: esterase/lipase family protein [Candidatus Binatia bacterium]
MADKLLLVHGYSDGSTSFTGLHNFFSQRAGYEELHTYYLDYTSMDDDTSYRDLADKLDTDYRNRFGTERVDVVCHSTGALVVRAWLVLHNERSRRRMGVDGNLPPCPVERLICFAPTNFGSDLALLGQSFLSKFRTTFFNSHSQAEDSFETGKALLQGLEPASPFQWQLSMYDLHDRNTYFSPEQPPQRRCYPFILSAGTGYTGLQAKLIKQRKKPGTDGTVRIPGTALNTRHCTLDFREDGEAKLSWYKEVKFEHIPFAVFAGFNHGSIIDPSSAGFEAPDGPGTLALNALTVTSDDEYKRVYEVFKQALESNYNRTEGDDRRCFQQFFFKVRDDVDLPVPDYFVDFHVVQKNGDPNEELTILFDEYFQASFYPHSIDPSHRVMLVDCSKLEEFHNLLRENRAKLMVEINGVSTCPSVKYRAQRFEVYDPERKDYEVSFLYPNTTTLVDIVLNREQMDRMLVIKGADLKPIAKVLKTRDQPEMFGGRAALIRNNPPD